MKAVTAANDGGEQVEIMTMESLAAQKRNTRKKKNKGGFFDL